ncbi:MAG TPA: molecular chaperone DjiA [Salinarimonas sp.]|nr:molecular chaperone DjiA [Salinarimonas sp.]
MAGSGIWGKIGGAGLGLALGGPLGGLMGALAGHVLVDREGAVLGAPPRDVVFTTGLVALAAKMAKSDGVVTRSELDVFRRIVDVTDEDRARVERLFDLAKSTTAGFEAYASQVAEAFRDEPKLLEDLLDGLFHIAKADGAVHERELAYLQSVSGILGFDETAFERVLARHVRVKDDPYLVLGADREMSDEALRRHYRALVKDIHPDRQIARGLPPEAVRIATDRLAAVNAAWERIRSERGLS